MADNLPNVAVDLKTEKVTVTRPVTELVVGLPGPAGPSGPTGPKGSTGQVGPTGPAQDSSYPTPATYGFLAWTTSPDPITAATQIAAPGKVGYFRLRLVNAATASKLWCHVGTAGAGLTAGQNFIGLYTGDGTLLAGSADQTTAWSSTGIKSAAITPQNLQAGDYLIVILSNGTTLPAFNRAPLVQPGLVNANLPITVAGLRVGLGQSSQTTLPATIVGATEHNSLIWCAVS